jgi:integrase
MSVFKRPGSPFYYCGFQIEGRKFLRSTRRTSEREARAEERRIKAAEHTKLKERRTDGITIDQGFAKYWREHGHKLAWASEVERYIKQILERVNGHMLVENMTDAEVNDFVQIRSAEGGGEYAINRALAIWRAMHKRARKRWKQKTQEIDWAEFFNPESKRVRFITLDEARHLIDCSPWRLAVAIEWTLYTGCRKEETYSLTRDDIFLDRGHAIVTAKGGKRQTIWLSEQAIDLLARIEPRGRYVFDRRGHRYAFEHALAKAGISDFRWHDLRHTHATWLRQSGAPVEIVQRSLGHAAIGTTMRYAHVDDGELRDALRRLPSLAGSTAKIVSIKSLKSQGRTGK